MKQEVFEGTIDEMKFDDPVKFKEYLEQHKDAKNVSYSHSIREVADEQPKAVEQGEEKACKKCNKKEKRIPQLPYVDIDTFLSDPTANIKDIEEKYKDFLDQHKRVINHLSKEELFDYRDALYQRRLSTKDLMKVNAQAIAKIDDENEKLYNQIKSNEDKRRTLDIAGDLLRMRYNTIKEALVDIKDDYDEPETTPKRSLLEDLFDHILSHSI